MKARIGDYSLNCFFAQPKSQFAFDVKLPERCYLEFGYGALEESLKKANNQVHLRIELEHKNGREPLFSKDFKPSKKNWLSMKKLTCFLKEERKSRYISLQSQLWRMKEMALR